MTKNRSIGNKGEEMAANFLIQKGYTILERNWRSGLAEIDIIAQDMGFIVFIEVKIRSTDAFGLPESFVNPHKEKMMCDASAVYMGSHQIESPFRFDIIGILLKKKAIDIKHIRDAFFPDLEYE